MKYRQLGKTGVDISEISLGTEGLSEQHEDRETIAATIRQAVDNGINFIDCPAAWPEFRDAEGAALAGIRGRVMLSAHLGNTFRKPETPAADLRSYIWSSLLRTRDPAICKASFEDFLSRLRTDYVDVLFLSWIDDDDDFDTAFDPEGFLGLAIRLKKEGTARSLALSTHRTTIGLKAIGTGAIDAIMFPVNAAHDLFPGDKGLETMWRKNPYQGMFANGMAPAADRSAFYRTCQQQDIGLIAMKPYGGGLLLKEGVVHGFLQGKDLQHPGGLSLTPVQCLSYVLSQPGISTALPGCGNPLELEAALAYYGASEVEKDFSAIDANSLWKLAGRCVYCNHCLPCPESIDVGGLIKLLDSEEHHRDPRVRTAYDALVNNASACTECGICVERCPFGVDVPARMHRAVGLFGA
jgi:predicted aldo/keto reductase-like oxidoreductase